MRILQECFRGELKKELELKKKKNPRYSLRAMSRALGVSSGTLSDFLNAKRIFSLTKIEKVLATTDLPLIKTRALVVKLRAAGRIKPTSVFELYPTHDRVAVDMDQFSMISDWHNFAILSLSETDDFKSDPEWIANRLDLAPGVVRESLERLVRLQLLDSTQPEDLKPTGSSFASPDGVASDNLREAQRQRLCLADKSLNRDDISQRDFFSMTMAINPQKIPEAKNRVRIFLDSLCDLLEVDTKSEVYQAQFQLFPLSRRPEAE